MRKLYLLVLLFSQIVKAENPLFIPPAINGPNIQLNLHADSVAFLSGMKTLTNGFNSQSYLGPTIITNKNDSLNIAVTNALSDTTTVHWHGLHVPATMDGGPHTYILSQQTWNPSFKVMNNAATYWYHAHLHMKTALQVMRGSAGVLIVHDSIETSLGLPTTYGIDDIPLVLQTQQFDSVNQIMEMGMADSIVMVNGTIEPVIDLPAQVVRLRLVNASMERTYQLGFQFDVPFHVIASDGGLLTASLTKTRIRLSPGERVDILVDLGSINTTDLYLMSFGSELPQGVQGGPPMGGMGTVVPNPLNGADFNLLHIHIVAPTPDAIHSLPTSLTTITPISASTANITRQLTFSGSMASMDGPFYINNQLFDMNRIDYSIPLNNTEIWTLRNQTMVAHPFHIHDVQFQILDRNNSAPPAEEQGWKDVVLVLPMETVRFITKFEDFADENIPYMYHCHILMHEDMGMMGQFIVSGTTGTTNSEVNDLKIYPNPATDKLIIKSEQVISDVRIFDYAGKQVPERINSGEKEAEFSVHTLSTGFYFIKCTSAKGTITRKFIKE